MRFLFVIQGEGRGHLTQAISLAQLLQAAGHEVIRAMVGLADRRPIPAFFAEQFPAPHTTLTTPELVYSPENNRLKVGTTIWRGLKQVGTFRKSMRQLHQTIEAEHPDVVVNFFELLCGLTYALHRPTAPVVSVGHQFMAFHPDFIFPKGKRLDRLVFIALVRLNAVGSAELLGLSFDEQPHAPDQRLRVVPPLLRREIQSLSPTTEPFFLAYTTQPGLRSVVLEAHRQLPQQALRYYHAGATAPETQLDATLTECQLDGQRYLTDMARCTAVVSTAGFESVCEAMWLGKPVLMMPQPNHYEQACNALDGQRAGAGRATDTFDLAGFSQYLSQHDAAVSPRFRAWQSRVGGAFLAALSRVATAKKTATLPTEPARSAEHAHTA